MLAVDTIVVPQGAEYQAVCRGLQRARVNNIEIIAIPIGVKSVDRFLADNHERLNHSVGVLIMGLGGSLTTDLRVGESVLVTSCQDSNRNVVYTDPKLTAQIEVKIAVKTAVSLTSERMITQVREKLVLAQEYKVEIVEMEGYGYITQLQQRGIAVAMLRVIGDNSQNNIPDLNRAIDPQGNLQALPMAISFVKQPVAGINLIKGSLTGLKALARITTELFTS